MPDEGIAGSELPYRLDLYRDAEEGVWFARYSELDGVKAHGETREEAIANAEELAALWIETAKEKGRPIPEPQAEPAYSGKLNVRLPKSLHERAVIAARNDDVSLNQFILEAIAERVERRGLVQAVAEAMSKLPDHGLVAWERVAGTNRHPLLEQEAEQQIAGPPGIAA